MSGRLLSRKVLPVAGVLALLLALVSCFLLGGYQTTAWAAEEPATTPPAASKTLTDNHDGTYTLSLSVTGSAETSSESSKADVIIVLDTSGSMDFETTTYSQNDTGRYGYMYGQYIQLYKYDESWWGGEYRELRDDTYSGTVYYRSGLILSSYNEYTGPRYVLTESKRLAVAKDSVNSLATQLLSNNTADNPDKVQLALVTFASSAHTMSFGWGGSASNWASGTDATPFTNAVNGLSANGGTNWEAALKAANNLETREGAEVYVIFVSDGNPTFYVGGGSGQETSNNIETCYNNAKDDARAIVNAGKHFYGIGVFGNVGRMQSLVTESGAPSGNYYAASDKTALQAAFKNIINQINNAFTYKDIEFTDQMTSMTSMLLAGDVANFTYTRSGGSYGTEATWAEAPSATYDGSAVTWDLGDMQLEDDVTYTVSFTVWPSQEAYDLVADLNNGLTAYDKLTADQQKQIVQTADGGYALNTNLEATLGYTQIQTRTMATQPDGYVSGQPANDGYTYTYDSTTGIYTGTKETSGTAALQNPDPIKIEVIPITIQKEWEDSLDQSQRPSSVTLNIMKDDTEYTSVELEAAEDWTGTVYVAPGLKVDETVLESGHDYSITEPTIDVHYELDGTSFHPMLVDGVLALNVNGGNGSETTVTVKNVLKGNLIITKTVSAADGLNPDPNTQFTVVVSFTKGDASWTPVTDDDVTYTITGGNTTPVKETFPVNGTFTLKADETITISNLPAGVNYKVTETGLPGGFALNENASEGLTGTIAGNSASEASLVNIYGVESATANISVTKELSAADDLTPPNIAGKYTFTLTAAEGTPMPDVTSLVNPASDGGTISFGNITFTAPGSYTYTVTESGQVAGIANDAVGSKTVTVQVTDDGAGSLSATVRGADSTNDAMVESTTFTNTYSVNPVTATIAAKKELVNADLAAGAFSFELTAANGTPMPASTGATNAADGTVTFGEITYSKPGTYTYTLAEVEGDYEYFEYDTKTYEVTVEVEDNSDGTMTATVTGDGAEATFTNTYLASSNEVFISAVKNVNGSAPDANIFGFTLTAGDGTPMPGTTTVTNNGGSVTFGPINYDASIFDNEASKVNVSFTCEQQGVESIKVQLYANGEPFDESSEVTAEDGKFAWTWNNLNKNDESGNEIDYTVKYWLVAEEVQDADSAMVKIEDVARSKTFTYTISEVAGSADGYTYDTHSETVTVTVTDEGEGNLMAEVAYDEDNAVFENTYAATGTATIEAKKVLTGADLVAEQFMFGLFEGDEQIATAYNDENGSIKFDVEYAYNSEQNDLGAHSYTVRELVDTPQAGYTYDSSSKLVIVKVSDNGDGTLSAEVSYDSDMTFKNSYKPLPTDVVLQAKKTLSGRDLTAGEFSFKIENSDGTVVSSGTNDASGAITFSAIPLTDAGTYTFTAYEVKGDAENVTYDNKRFTYTVTVVDKDGQLQVIEASPADDAVFANTYTPPKPVTPSMPTTGDSGIIAIIVVAAVAAACVAILVATRIRKSR